jgi:transposase
LRERRTIIFIDESGLSERPYRVRTWGPRGQTPVLQYHFNWNMLSVAAGITWWNFYFRFYPDTIGAAQVVDFLGHLLRHLPGKLLVLWDGLSGHKARLTKQFIAAQRGRLVTEILPSYAPELNPVEYIWGYWKKHELPNFCPRDFAQLSYRAPSRFAPHASPPTARKRLLETGSAFPVAILWKPQ